MRNTIVLFGGESESGFYNDTWEFTFEPCYPDLDGSGELDLFDSLSFLNLFNGGDPKADCDLLNGLNFFDFLCFQNRFEAGCG